MSIEQQLAQIESALARIAFALEYSNDVPHTLGASFRNEVEWNPVAR